MEITPHSWYVDSEDRLLQVEGVIGSDHVYIPPTITATRISTSGETSWIHAAIPVDTLTPAKPEEIETGLKSTRKWLKSSPDGVLRNGVHWQSTAGVDPEMFLETSRGQLIEAFKVLPDKSHALSFQGDSMTWAAKGYWDGFQMELAVQPHYCHARLVDYIRAGLEGTLAHVRKTVPGARYALKTVVEVPKQTLLTENMDYIQLGCKPSENVYGICGLQVDEPRDLKWRFAGGHYHFDPKNWKGLLTPEVRRRMIQAADVVVGIPSVAMFQNWDNPIRRMYYGLAGEHRLPKYGVEYRVLSNAWMFHPAVAHFTIELIRAGLKLGFRDLLGCFEFDQENVIRTIIAGDVDAAKKHVKKNEKVYRWLFGPIVERGIAEYKLGSDNAGKVLNASMAQLQEPVDNFAPMTSVEENWHLFKEDWEPQCNSKNAQWQRLILGV